MTEPEPEPETIEPDATGEHDDEATDTATPARVPTIGLADRVIALGMTGSGKSGILQHLFASFGGQRLFVDVNDDYVLGPDAIADPGGVCECEKVRDLDFRRRTIRFIPRGGQAVYNDLYAAIFEQGNMLVALDECYGPTTSNSAPEWLRRTIQQGRKRRILHAAASQEPANILPVLISQANHAFVFELGSRRDDLDRVGARVGWTGRELGDELRDLASMYPAPAGSSVGHGYLRHSLGSPHVYRFPPLPPDVYAHAMRHIHVGGDHLPAAA